MTMSNETTSTLEMAPAHGATPWPDFYAILNVPDDADEQTLKRRMAACYALARTNWDHPDVQRRAQFRHFVNQILPDCHLILLDEQRRAEYDWYLSYQRAGDPTPDYTAFVAEMRAQRPPVKVIASREEAVQRLAAQSPRFIVEPENAPRKSAKTNGRTHGKTQGGKTQGGKTQDGKSALHVAGAAILRQVQRPRHA